MFCFQKQQFLFVDQQTEPTNRVLESFTHGYEDRLQVPLQPLADNLESRTYEIFEKDPIKYVQYENVGDIKDKYSIISCFIKAIYQALVDRYDQKTPV